MNALKMHKGTERTECSAPFGASINIAFRPRGDVREPESLLPMLDLVAGGGSAPAEVPVAACGRR